MEPINVIVIYYSDKKLPKTLHFLEADRITIKKYKNKTEDLRPLAQQLKISSQLKGYIY